MFRIRIKTVSAFKYMSTKDSPYTICDVPRPKNLPLIGTKLDLFVAGGGAKLHEYIDNRHKELGPIFCEKLSTSELVFISEPKLMKSLFLRVEGKYPIHILPEPWVLYEKLYGSKRGLFFMDGEEWLTNRRIMNKHLLLDDPDKWFEEPLKMTITSFINELNNKIDSKTAHIIPNLESDLYKLSTNAVIAVLMGSSSKVQKSMHFNELLCKFSDTVKGIFETTTALFGLPVNICQKLNLPVWKDFKECVDESLILAHKLINEMLDHRNQSDGLIKKLSDENITDENIIRIAADFVMAAGDTTSYTTLWTMHLLSTHREVTDEILHTNGTYVKNVIRESMRLYPVAPFLTRILPKDSFIGPYKLQQGVPVIASIYTSGRDEKYFSRANEFLPYRWDRNGARRSTLANHEPSASLPFAMGARSCIGKKMAMMQMTEFIKQLVHNFHIHPSEESNKVKAVTSGVLVPDRPLKLALSQRK
ncbi:hypothetical protein JYU34_005764 [Plutella xylostella]|uniref:Cholesterol side-chain cleavage enzyme, mitochondrial n=1 Tax=Plutella xylostella TaxID=51655 RepID=A0ABQ7QU27_PLUXY|nr:hypothetical protein JYU34_005764 [Plutella xylostella]